MTFVRGVKRLSPALKRQMLSIVEDCCPRSALVVDDDPVLADSLTAALEETCQEVRTCHDVSSAQELLAQWVPELLVLDVALPDGRAFDVLEVVAQRRPTPLVVAISGQATPDESFRLAHLGVRAFLSKPFTTAALRQAIETARKNPVDLKVHVRCYVGERPIHEVETEVRDTMLEEALARARGNRRGAARLLQVSRQVVQHMVKLRKP